MPVPEKPCSDPPGHDFRATHWSVVIAAGQLQSPKALEALETLCRDYWFPLYAYARKQGQAPRDAEDLTQAFFAEFLEKNFVSRADPNRGRFRTFLLVSFKHFILNEWNRGRALRRGGGKTIVSWDAQSAESCYEFQQVDLNSPDKIFDRNWALTALERALSRVHADYIAAGNAVVYDQLRSILWEDPKAETYADLGARLGMTEAAVKMAVMRLRRRCRESLRHEVAQTVAESGDVEEEWRHLLASLRPIA